MDARYGEQGKEPSLLDFGVIGKISKELFIFRILLYNKK